MSYVKVKLAPALILCMVLLGLAPLFAFSIERGGFLNAEIDPVIFHILWFTLKQAFLSTLISVAVGIFVARALSRRQFVGHEILLSVFAVPLALPAIVVVLAITSIFGAQGLLGGWFNIYGLSGILLAHVFFNMPLATRLFVEAFNTIPQENFRLAEQLNFSDRAIFTNLEWPILRNVLPRICGLIFLLCAASFVIVLTLGGPSATTLEVAIYQSLRQDFDVARALSLSAIQISLCLVLVFAAGKMALHNSALSSFKTTSVRRDGQSATAKIVDGLAFTIAVLFIIPPIIALIVSGLPYLNFNLQACVTSVAIAFPAAMISVGFAWALARNRSVTSQLAALASLIVPPAVLATGWFLALRRFDESFSVVILSIIALNALMALPFAVSVLAPAFAQISQMHERLCAQLNITGWNKLQLIDLPMMRRPLAQALLMAFVLSLGDLTAVTLLGTQGLITVPSLIHQQMGHYRGNDAGGTALLLATFCFTLTLIAQRLGIPNDQD